MKSKSLNKIIGQNIKIALKETGITQQQLSSKLNISRQTLNNYITGSTIIDFKKMLAIADITDKSLDFFYKQDKSAKNYKFRSDIPIDYVLKIKFAEKIKKYNEIEEINCIQLCKLKLEYNLDKFDKEKIKNIAEKTRRLFNISPYGPISNPVYELEKNDIKIIQFPAQNRVISGFSESNEKFGDCIYINSEITVERRYFTAIHELAHLIFHKSDYIKDLRVENEKLKEQIADEFAGHFLIPSKALKDILEANFIKKISYEDVIYLKRFFNVSAKCMVRRIFKESVINSKEHEYLNDKIDSIVNIYSEPEPIEEYKHVQNYRFNNLVKKAYIEGKINVTKVAELLEITVLDADKKVKKWLSN